MSNRFISDWTRKSTVPLSQKIAGTLHPSPLKNQLSQTVYRLNVIQKRLNDARLRMERKHQTLFTKCVRSQEAKDSASATMYANECAQVRKMTQTILTSGLALEQVTLRLETIKDFGDVATAIMPTAAVVQHIQGRLAGVLPDVSMQLGMIGNALDAVVLETGQTLNQSWSAVPAGEEAETILAEASAIAEQKMKDTFPQLPTHNSVERLTPSS